ncbi:MAG: rod shape-determining protein RodA, partial [Gammaproteobacteria bacterium]
MNRSLISYLGRRLIGHLDLPLLFLLCLLSGVGLLILYSAGGKEMDIVLRQLTRMGLAFGLLFILAQISPKRYQLWAPWFFSAILILLVIVLLTGHIGKGAQRWLSLGFFRFQPSEFMKLAMPMMLAWYFHIQPLPPRKTSLLIASIFILIPTLLVAKQPDLGTALLIATAGMAVVLFAGVSWKLLIGLGTFMAASAPILWHFLHHYQRERILTFLSPERDPLGSGYQIIQSKIAIGSGGFFGKGWLQGTQSHLQFLPEHTTDFIFAVAGEEFGFMGGLILILLFLLILLRGLYISINAQDTFSRLLAGSICLTFFVSLFVNINMVTGALPVVGVPLPLIS